MRTSDVDILIVPGWSSSGPDHWQTRWQRSLKTARRVEQDDWFVPDRDRWVARIAAEVARSARPPVLVAHSLGCAAVAHAALRLPKGLVAGAFLVAPADVDNAARWPVTNGHTFDAGHGGFAPLPTAALPFPAIVVGSTTDPYCTLERATELAGLWGAAFADSGDAGHINVESGHGPWPEGLLRFGSFLKGLD